MFLMDGVTTYNPNIDVSDLAKFDKINETYQMNVEAGQTAQGGLEGLSQEGIDPGSAKDLWNSVGTFFSAISIVPELIADTAEELHIPKIIWLGMLAIVILVIVIAILKLFGIVSEGAG